MNPTLFIVLSFLNVAILIAAFIYGIVNILVKKGASYFKFLVCAVGCYSIAELLRITYYLCYGEQAGITGMFAVGYFGCFLFMFSASSSPFDSIIDDGGKAFRKYRIIPIIAPIIFGVSSLWAYSPLFDSIALKGYLIILFMNLPKLAASYYNLKHLIFPDMGYGFINGVRLCNAFALLIYICDIVYTYAAVVGNRIWVLICGFILNIFCIGLMLSAKRGIKKWQI